MSYYTQNAELYAVDNVTMKDKKKRKKEEKWDREGDVTIMEGPRT